MNARIMINPLLLAASLAVVATASAKKVHPLVDNCTARILKAQDLKYAVLASCSVIAPHEEVRGVADFKGQLDVQTQWFTVTQQPFYSSFQLALFGTPTARIEIRSR
jgi:hypothetical protein